MDISCEVATNLTAPRKELVFDGYLQPPEAHRSSGSLGEEEGVDGGRIGGDVWRKRREEEAISSCRQLGEALGRWRRREGEMQEDGGERQAVRHFCASGVGMLGVLGMVGKEVSRFRPSL